MRSLLFAVLALLLAPAAAAQQSEIFEEFQFQQLKFQVWPGGVENRAKSDGVGSAVTVHVERAVIEDIDAVELRHCIDGDESFCTYEIPGGNADGVVTAAEVESFQTFAQVGLRAAVPRVNDFAKTLQNNVSIDGLKGKNVALTRVEFQGAEGNTDSNTTVLAFIDAKVTYDNDAKAERHTIVVGNLSLHPQGFVYADTIWVVVAEGWGFDAAGTQPDTARSLVNVNGYFSPQARFESLAEQGLTLVVAKGAGAKKSPGPELVVLVGAIAVAAMLRRL